MAKKNSNAALLSKIGSWSFIIGVLLAIAAGFFGFDKSFTLIALSALGLIVGFLNISDEETVPFLVAAVALMLGASSFSAALATIFKYVPWIGTGVLEFLAFVPVFVAPAAGVVAIKAIYEVSKSAD